MKLNSIILILSFIGLTINAEAQIKIHDNGGISIGSITEPDSKKTVFADPTVFEGDINISTVSSNLIPDDGDTYNLGVSGTRWNKLYSRYIDVAILDVSTSVTSNLRPSVDNTYSLGEVNPGGTYGWKDLRAYNIITETINLNGVDLDVTTDGYGGRFYITTSGGDLSFGVGYGSSATILTSKSYYDFDEEIRAKGVFLDSDLTLKEDVAKIKDSGSSMEKLKDLEGITFKFKEDKDNMKYAGFSAQELQKILPDLVFEDEEGLLSVNYIGLIPYLLEALKELDVRIDALEKLLKDK